MNNNKDVTVVCCFNNEKVYNDFVNTLSMQDCSYDLIGIDNTGNKKFSSCSSTYNSVVNDISTEFVIYSHQDILLDKSDMLSKFVSYLKKTNSDDILGVAGVRFGQAEVFTNIKEIEKTTGKIVSVGEKHVEGNIMKCDTIDECFFGGHSEYFKKNLFDEKICDNWHLYAVEQCLRTKSKYGKGGEVYICDIDLIHRSHGVMNFALIYNFYRLCGKYSSDFTFISTTCTRAKTDFIHRQLYFAKYGMIPIRPYLKYVGYDWLKKFF